MTKNNKPLSPFLVNNSPLYVAGRFITLFIFALLVRFFFIRKGFTNYSAAWTALNFDKNGPLPVELLSLIFKLFKPYYTDLTIPANLLAVICGALAVIFWVGAIRMERRELSLPCAMAFSYLPLPVIVATSWNLAALEGLLWGVTLFCFAKAGKKESWLYFILFGIFLGFSFALDLLITFLLLPFFICVLITRRKIIGKILVFSVPVLLLVLIMVLPGNWSQNLYKGLEKDYWDFLWQTGRLLIDEFSLPVLIGYLWAIGYLVVRKEKITVLCSLSVFLVYLIVPLSIQTRFLLPFFAVIITLNYGILRFLENSPGYSLEHYILVTTFLTFFYFVTTPAKAILFAQYGAERNEDRIFTRQVREVIGDGRLLASEYFNCFGFYSYSTPLQINRVSLTTDTGLVIGLEPGLLALKEGKVVTITSGVRNILHQASIYPKGKIILEDKRTNIYKITNF
jgi:hypothetical protein